MSTEPQFWGWIGRGAVDVFIYILGPIILAWLFNGWVALPFLWGFYIFLTACEGVWWR